MRVHDRIDVIVEAGMRGAAVGEGAWDVGLWDSPTSTWSGIEPTFAALDGWEILSVQTNRGRDRANRRHPSGTAEVRLGWRSAAGKWSYRPTSPVQLGQEMRISARPRSLAGVPLVDDPIPIYRGAVRRIVDGWSPGTDLFTLTCSLSDRFADLGAVDLPEQAVASGLDDLTGARVARILDLAGISDYYLRGAAGVVHHQSSTFARNLLDESQVAAESETGDLYVDREGFYFVRERLSTGSYPRETVSQLTWSNDPAADDAIAPIRFGTGMDLDDVVNQVSAAKTGGTAYTTTDTDSALIYGLRTTQRFDLTCRYDADVEAWADFWLEQLAGRTQRVDAVQANIGPNMPDDRLVELIDVEIGDLQTIRWTDDGSSFLEGTLHVQGVQHQIAGDRWTVQVNLWAFAGEGLEPVDTVARWGSAQWGVAKWSSAP